MYFNLFLMPAHTQLLTPRAVKDYNRARAYLTSLANKNKIPVHSDIKEAVLCSIDQLRSK